MARKDQGKQTGEAVTYQMPSPAGGVAMETFIPWTLVKRGVRRQVVTPLDTPQAFAAEAADQRRESHPQSPLIRALGLAHYWQQLIDDGRFQTMFEIATAEGVDRGQASRIAQLARLAPDIVDRCLAREGDIALEHLIRRGIPADWATQRVLLGVGQPC